jgi:hypothetical protein
VTPIKPAIETAEDAILAAEQFLRRYLPNLHPMTVRREDNVWRMEFDVSMVGSRFAHISLDVETGKVVAYEVKQ